MGASREKRHTVAFSLSYSKCSQRSKCLHTKAFPYRRISRILTPCSMALSTLKPSPIALCRRISRILTPCSMALSTLKPSPIALCRRISRMLTPCSLALPHYVYGPITLCPAILTLYTHDRMPGLCDPQRLAAMILSPFAIVLTHPPMTVCPYAIVLTHTPYGRMPLCSYARSL